MPQTATRYFSARGDRDILAPFSEAAMSNVVAAVFAPLPTLAKGGGVGNNRTSRFVKPPPLGSDKAPAYRRKTLPHLSPRSPLIASSLADLSPGVMFTDGASFTGTSRLRILGSFDPLARPAILPTLGKKQQPSAEPEPEPVPEEQLEMTPAEQAEDEERKRLRRSSDERLIEQVGAGNHEQPGEGINASPTALAAPKSWGLVKDGMMKQLAKTRRAYLNIVSDFCHLGNGVFMCRDRP